MRTRLETSYLEAWSYWASGEKIDDQLLWGMEILWWGRIGKVVGLISALAVVAEIIGPKRLREAGSSIRSQYNLRSSWLIVTAALKSIWYFFRFLFSSSEKSDDWHNLFLSTVIGKVVTAIIAVTFILIFGFFFISEGWWPAIKYSFLWSFFGTILLTLLLAGLALLVSLPVAIFDLVIIQPFAWTLERNSIGLIVKLASVFFLLVGFHFDLLAS